MVFRTLRMQISLVLLVSLMGCEPTLTYDYLMLHPDVLQEKYAACEESYQAAECDMVMQAANAYSTMLKEREYDPVEFGLKVMQAQEQLVELANMKEQANASGDQKIIKMANEAYAAEYQKIREFYAVIASMRVN